MAPTPRCSSSRTRRAAGSGSGRASPSSPTSRRPRRAGICRRRGSAFCLDTAHAWAAGIDVAEPAAIDAFLADFDTRIGLDRLVMVHLNDSKSELGRASTAMSTSARAGSACRASPPARHPALAHVAYYLETPGMDEGYDAVNVARAYDIAAGRPLADLPPEAMSSSRPAAGPPSWTSRP